MSNATLRNNANNPPPVVPIQFTTDDGIAVPAANNLNVLGGSGVETYADPDPSDNLFIKIKNSNTAQAQTIGAVTADIITVPLTVAGTYTFEIRVAAWESTGPNGGGYSKNAVIRSTGAAATLIGDSDGFVHTDTALEDSDVNIIASGNNAIIRLLGVAGLTINWGAFSVYIFRGI